MQSECIQKVVYMRSPLVYHVFLFDLHLFAGPLPHVYCSFIARVTISLATHSHLVGHTFRPPWPSIYVSFAMRLLFLTRVYNSIITRSSTGPNVCKTRHERLRNINALYLVSDHIVVIARFEVLCLWTKAREGRGQEAPIQHEVKPSAVLQARDHVL